MHLDLQPTPPPGAFRKLALGTWRASGDPSAYAAVEVRMERALAFLEAHKGRTGQRLTVTHLVAKVAADALRRHPDANVLLRWNRPFLRKDVGVCVLVVQPGDTGRADLTTATVHRADALSLASFAEAMASRIDAVRARRDAVIERGKRRSYRIPGFLMGLALRLLSFVWFTLNVDLRWVGMPWDPFGSVAVTSLGSLGLERGYVALVPYTRVPLLLAPGAVRTEPVLDAGTLAVGKVMTLTCTWDARVIGVEDVAAVLRHIGAALEDPEGAWGPADMTRGGAAGEPGVG
ncbi:Dihydrolipoamide acyltransferase component of branched-chain alpha-keto acid dehydrogenase complex [Myxococcus hansupus]|uniref:Dihydrolipoamide acyltransferase component of branched-chain alpha-keto acid dehydrogenase complex n=1 Tax=Pseudomyxococcus hansupus TaxID=1297742 RepID=A0A0H4WPD4_9BACT|nr:Dihydrolipoamide acyltransferase component of branched-chain alpha-keto acid dehydrogenase complex [Myxococcus hansupus]